MLEIRPGEKRVGNRRIREVVNDGRLVGYWHPYGQGWRLLDRNARRVALTSTCGEETGVICYALDDMSGIARLYLHKLDDAAARARTTRADADRAMADAARRERQRRTRIEQAASDMLGVLQDIPLDRLAPELASRVCDVIRRATGENP